MIVPGKGRRVMPLSFVRISALILTVVILLLSIVISANGAEVSQKEITLREDGLLQSSVSSLVAGLGATVCVTLVFVIVWKQWEL